MLFANLNVFILLFACAFYLALWLLDTTTSVLLVPRSGMAAMTLAGCAGVALLLMAIWVRKGMAPGAPGKFYWAGQAPVAIANVALAGGMRLSLHAASISKEEEVWFTMVMLYMKNASGIPALFVSVFACYTQEAPYLKALMTTEDTKAFADKVVPGSSLAKALQRHADNLDSVSGLLHGSAYQPVHQAIRLLRRLSHERTYPETIHVEEALSTAGMLRHYASTVSGRATTVMCASALALEELAAQM